MIFLLMGVSGSGKTTIGTLLAERLNAMFADADVYHSAANKQKMAAGIPLTDADRVPWLETLHGLLMNWYRSRTSGVLACSALKQSYRELLLKGMPAGAVQLVFLELSKEALADRLAHRQHEYMNPVLLESQLQTLETPKDAFTVENDRTPEAVAETILRHFEAAGAAQAK